MKRIVKWLMALYHSFMANQCPMHAAGLTYFSMLALVPILCVLLFTAKTCGVDEYAHARINEYLDTMISSIERGQEEDVVYRSLQSEEELERKRIVAEEFGRQAREIANGLFERIDNFDISTLGWIGFGFLLWTVISSISMIELSFNRIFGVRKVRPIWQRATLYLLISIALPIFVALALSVPVIGIVKSFGVFEGIITFLDSWFCRFWVTLAIASVLFAFLFWFIPNRAVSFKNAWYGGVVTALLFGFWLKLCAIAQIGIAKTSALYGSFAFLPIVLAWTYMSWQIVLLGANIVRRIDIDFQKKFPTRTE